MSSIPLEELSEVDILVVYSLQLHIFHLSGRAGRSWCFTVVYSTMSSISLEELDKVDILLLCRLHLHVSLLTYTPFLWKSWTKWIFY